MTGLSSQHPTLELYSGACAAICLRFARIPNSVMRLADANAERYAPGILFNQGCYGRYGFRLNSFCRATKTPMSSQYNLLVYYDGSPESRAALLRAAQLGYALTGTVHVLSVVDIASAIGASHGCLPDVVCSQLESAAKEALREAMDHLKDSGTVAFGHLATGNAVDSMARYASLLNAELLVLGHRNPRGLARWLGPRPHHAELVKRAAGRAVITVPLD